MLKWNKFDWFIKIKCACAPYIVHGMCIMCIMIFLENIDTRV